MNYYNEFDPKAAAWVILTQAPKGGNSFDPEENDKLDTRPTPYRATRCLICCAPSQPFHGLACVLFPPLGVLHKIRTSEVREHSKCRISPDWNLDHVFPFVVACIPLDAQDELGEIFALNLYSFFSYKRPNRAICYAAPDQLQNGWNKHGSDALHWKGDLGAPSGIAPCIFSNSISGEDGSLASRRHIGHNLECGTYKDNVTSLQPSPDKNTLT